MSNNLMWTAYLGDEIAHDLICRADLVDTSTDVGKLLAIKLTQKATARMLQVCRPADYEWITHTNHENYRRIAGAKYIYRQDTSKVVRESRHPASASPSYWRDRRRRKLMTRAERRLERTWAEVRAMDRLDAARAYGSHRRYTDATDRTRFDINYEW